MLNYSFAMLIHSSSLLISLFSLFWISSRIIYTPAQAEPTSTLTPTPAVFFLNPVNGQVLQGSIPIQVQGGIENIISFELTFGYTNDPTGTWFLISQGTQFTSEQPLARWDTTLLTDGYYNLRLFVFLSNDQQIEIQADGLRVRNYTPIETNTPTPITPTSTPEQGDLPVNTLTPTTTITLTPTQLPTNPAELTQGQITHSLGHGALAACVIFILVGGFFGLRRAQLNKHK